jgi:hypothetical protein
VGFLFYDIFIYMKFIINESQYKRLVLKEHYPGTKKPMGVDGVDEKVFKEILTLMKTTFAKENGFQQTASEVESKGKVATKQQKDIIEKAIYLMDTTCEKNNYKFNEERFVGFCSEITEVLYSDNDNIFSHSYGWL